MARNPFDEMMGEGGGQTPFDMQAAGPKAAPPKKKGGKGKKGGFMKAFQNAKKKKGK